MLKLKSLETAHDVAVRVSPRVTALEMSLDAGFVRRLDLTTGGLVRLVRSAFALETLAVVVLASGNLRGALEILQAHATVGVPDQVTVHHPRARVVGLEANNRPAGSEASGAGEAKEEGGVTANRVVEVEKSNHVGGEHSTALTEHGEIVAVKMHGVRGLEVVLNHKVDPRLGWAVQDIQVRVQGAVIAQGGKSCQSLERRLIVGHVDALAGHGRATVLGQTPHVSQEPSDDGSVTVENLSTSISTRQELDGRLESFRCASGLGDVGHKAGNWLILAIACGDNGGIGCCGRTARALVCEDAVGRGETIVDTANTATGLGHRTKVICSCRLTRALVQ